MHESIDQALRDNIRRYIRLSGLKQGVVAERSGFKVQYFSNMLAGRQLIKAEFLPSIARTLGVTPNDLLAVERSA